MNPTNLTQPNPMPTPNTSPWDAAGVGERLPLMLKAASEANQRDLVKETQKKVIGTMLNKVQQKRAADQVVQNQAPQPAPQPAPQMDADVADFAQKYGISPVGHYADGAPATPQTAQDTSQPPVNPDDLSEVAGPTSALTIRNEILYNEGLDASLNPFPMVRQYGQALLAQANQELNQGWGINPNTGKQQNMADAANMIARKKQLESGLGVGVGPNGQPVMQPLPGVLPAETANAQANQGRQAQIDSNGNVSVSNPAGAPEASAQMNANNQAVLDQVKQISELQDSYQNSYNQIKDLNELYQLADGETGGVVPQEIARLKGLMPSLFNQDGSIDASAFQAYAARQSQEILGIVQAGAGSGTRSNQFLQRIMASIKPGMDLTPQARTALINELTQVAQYQQQMATAGIGAAATAAKTGTPTPNWNVQFNQQYDQAHPHWRESLGYNMYKQTNNQPYQVSGNDDPALLSIKPGETFIGPTGKPMTMSQQAYGTIQKEYLDQLKGNTNGQQ